MFKDPYDNRFARKDAFHNRDGKAIGSEVEVSRFIADVVSLVKPRLVVETGIHVGDTTVELVGALDENQVQGFPGSYVGFEIDAERMAKAEKRIAGFKDVDLVLVNGKIEAWNPDMKVDVAFVDSGWDSRLDDMRHLAQFMAPLGLMFLHDSQLRPLHNLMGVLRQEMNVIEFPTPRGLALIQPKGNLWDGKFPV